jgi:deoxyribonuclease (pyrimidine dimer)
MTRINSNIDPKTLKRLHLIAEYREITMVPASLKRSLRTKSIENVLKSVPPKFTLNKGHVSFFFNKLGFLKTRFELLCDELTRRGYKCDRTREIAFEGVPSVFYGQWNSTPTDDDIVIERIKLRISEKPHLYND